jgi:aconitate hydratase
MLNNLSISNNHYHFIDLPAYAGDRLTLLPITLRILLENVLRQSSFEEGSQKCPSAEAILNWQPQAHQRPPIPFQPSRVLLQDLTGVPLLVDLAAIRSAAARIGVDPKSISPKVPVDLVIDHSLQVDFNHPPNPKEQNLALEYQRNQERYQLLRWAQEVLPQFRVVPPGKGIVHQVNLEYLATVVARGHIDNKRFIFPDTVFGTDSHTPMINGLGVLGWGVGGIEAIAAMLQKPTELILPDVIGLSFHGVLPEGTTPTDLTLRIVERLRQKGVVGKFIECFGKGLGNISIADRAMIANMAPETGATVIYFPVDEESLAYLRLTGRRPDHIELVEKYYKKQNLFRDPATPRLNFTDVIDVDLSTITPSLAGPFRPQDRVEKINLKKSFLKSLKRTRNGGGYGISPDHLADEVTINLNNQTLTLHHGSLLIAAITSCTNTSNPMVMLAAGLLAKNAVNLGLKVNPAVKSSLMPGSQVVSAYLERAGLLTPLEKLGFIVVGYGCGTCIGNSGPLAPEIEAAIKAKPLITASILSGNRNFEGRIHPLTQANYLASPPLVVAYAIAGKIDIDLTTEPLGISSQGVPIFLADIYPSREEIENLYEQIQPELYRTIYADIFTGDHRWKSILPGQPSDLFSWDPSSTYITEPPYLSTIPNNNTRQSIEKIQGARVLALLGDSVTTDHISPAGSIPKNSPAGEYLQSLGIEVLNFNTYGARRGNDKVMVRGTFANIRLKNHMVPELEGGYTRHYPSSKVMTIFEASQKYKSEGVPLIVIGGKEYGTGSSRDWAAKGPLLLGIRAIIAESFERIHRSNLVGMGILPLSFKPGENAAKLGLTGEERFDLLGLELITANGICKVRVIHEDNNTFNFDTIIKIETESELNRFLKGGILWESLI